MSQMRDAFNRAKHEAVKGMKSKELCVYISQEDIFNARVEYGETDYWKFIADKFKLAHGVFVTDREKLILYTTLSDTTMKISGHIGYSLSDRKE